jgi:cytochrome c
VTALGAPSSSSPVSRRQALVAYLLFINGVIAEDAVMDQSSLPRVRMPARDRFVLDNRRGGPKVK